MSVINDLYNIILDRKVNADEGSYTAYLFEKGLNKILKKVGEESTEVIIAAKEADKEEVINEVVDLSYHLMVMLAELDIPISDVEAEFEKRRQKIGNKKTERKEITNL